MQNPKAKDCSILRRESFLADLGELAGPVTHEINNVFNNVALHLAVLQQTGPANLAPDLMTVRRQITRAAEVIRAFQRYRGCSMAEPELIDLNASIRSVADEISSQAAQAPITLELETDLPPVRGFEADARRLCRFLLSNAVRAVSQQGSAVLIRTTCSEGAVLMQVEDTGPDVPDEMLSRLFLVSNDEREGMCTLELAACNSIVRRLDAKLWAQPRLGGGIIMSVKWPGSKNT